MYTYIFLLYRYIYIANPSVSVNTSRLRTAEVGQSPRGGAGLHWGRVVGSGVAGEQLTEVIPNCAKKLLRITVPPSQQAVAVNLNGSKNSIIIYTIILAIMNTK